VSHLSLAQRARLGSRHRWFAIKWPGALKWHGIWNRFIQRREQEFRTERSGALGRLGIGNRFIQRREQQFRTEWPRAFFAVHRGLKRWRAGYGHE
jgi:hypothetical protein